MNSTDIQPAFERPAARGPIAILVGLALLTGVPALAQYEDDDKLEDYAEQDRKYLERYQKEAAPVEVGTPEEIEAALFARVETLIRDRNYAAADTDRVRVQTDDPRVDPAAAAALVEAFRDYFAAFWADRLTLKPYDKTTRVFLFYSFYKYNQLLTGDFRFSSVRPKGHYGSLFDAITLHTDADRPGDLPDTLIHEAAHQMVDQRLGLSPGESPIWLSEGLASYFGNMYRDRDGQFEPQVVGGKSAALFRDGKVYAARLPGLGLRTVRQALKRAGDGDSLFESLLWISDPNAFYGEAAEVHYNASWILVHYLLHGPHAEAFSRYLLLEGQGQGGPDILMKELGLTYQALDAEVARYAGQVKDR